MITDAPRPVFLMGNKRSGTSLLVRLLNAHPNVFVSHEADVIWILYQIQRGCADGFSRYPWDGLVGLQTTLDACQEIFAERVGGSDRPAIPSLFRKVQEHLMRRAYQSKGRERKHPILWLGDKKPVQHCDPEIRPFLKQNFVDARYLHIVRHPTAVVASMSAAAATWSTGVPPFWCSNPDEILERWTIHEEWVLEAKQVDRMPVHSLRLEDLAFSPIEMFRRVLAFLDLEMSSSLATAVQRSVRPSPNGKHGRVHLQFSPRARRVMDYYGYAENIDECDPADPWIK